MGKVIIHTKGIQRSLDYYHSGKCGTRMLFGIIELQRFFNAKLYNLNNIWKTTWNILLSRCDVIFIIDFLPKLYLPFPILKLLTFNQIKFIVLMHSHPYGKGKRITDVKWYKKFLLNFWCKGIDKALFFDSVSLKEAVDCKALVSGKCQMIHWGEDMDFINKTLPSIVSENYWVSSGKERRDLDLVRSLMHKCPKGKFVYAGPQYTYAEALSITSRSRGVIVTPNKDGLTYCCGITNILEAFALGKPVICVRNEHYPFDIEKEGCGFYVELHEEEKIIELMSVIDENEDLYISMSKNALRMAKQFNMAIYAEELKEIIENL